MGLLQLNQREGNNVLTDWPDAYISPQKKSGFVATLDTSRKKHKGAHTMFYGLNDLDNLIKQTMREKPLTNVYLSLNAFKKGLDGQLYRRAENLAQIRNIGLDIDCYNVGLSPDAAADVLKESVAKGEIPNPNLVIWSGNGLQLIYSIQGGAAPSLAWLAEYITTQLAGKTSKVGADFACTDITRVFRLPGTINAKPGKEKKLVRVEMWRALEYDLSELYDYCEPKRLRNKYKGTTAKVYDLPSIAEEGRRLQSLNLSRSYDLINLIELRGGEIELRTILLYDYAFCLALNNLAESNVIQAAENVNNRFNDPQKSKEVQRIAKSAYKDARKFWAAFKANEYNTRGLESRLIKPKKTITLIETHSITEDEQQEMRTLIGQEVKYGRKKAKRRAAGMKTMDEYNSIRNAQKGEKAAQLAELKAQYPDATQKQLADLMGVSQQTISRLLKQI